MAKIRQNSKKQVDKLTAADLAIFKLAQIDANYFTDHYLRKPTSGTYWYKRPSPPDDDKAAVWEMLYFYWKKGGKPAEVFESNNIIYRIQWDEEQNPVFWHHHGFLMLPWQLNLHHYPQQEQTIVGGYGSSKTTGAMATHAVLMPTIPYYRGYHIAPKMLQANEVYRKFIEVVSDTPYWNRWVWAYPTKPYPKIVVKNSYVGESTLEILSLEHDLDKVLTLEANNITVDQGEQFAGLDELVEKLGTRLRGSVAGQARVPGKLAIFANSDDNQELWDRYDMAEYEPNIYWSFSPHTEDNIYLSKQDIEKMKRSVGGTDADIDQKMHGGRPIGSGEHFNQQMVQLCIDDGLSAIMEGQLALSPDNPDKIPGYIQNITAHVGLTLWEMPPDKGRAYIVIGDPGQGNPPHRNSAPIMVWDVTDFPAKPAVLRAFNWVAGKGSYWPFITSYEEYVRRYDAYTRNAFDSTGAQKGFDELVFATMGLAAEGMDLSGSISGKMHALNAAKFFMGRGMMQFPFIGHLINQLTKYTLPDTKIRQDLVMCLAMSALYIRRYYYEEIPDLDEHPRRRGVYHDSRYARSGGDRYPRSTNGR